MKISILGLGAYGIALAKTFFENDNKVSMWTKFQDEADIVLLKRENINCFPGVKIPRGIEITTDIEKCVENAKIIVIAVPIGAVRDVCKMLKQCLKDGQVICIVSKGIEEETNKLMDEVVYEETSCEDICMLSGPSFAIELVKNNEIGFTVASTSSIARTAVKICLENRRIVVNISKDIEGVEASSSIKNVFAIILGIADGLKCSDSTRATILTILINDFKNIVELMGGRSQTIFSYAGIGDLLLTCMSKKSRNYSFGYNLGKGMGYKEALDNLSSKTVEGISSLNALKSILDKKEINIKSINMLYDIVYNNMKVESIIRYIK